MKGRFGGKPSSARITSSEHFGLSGKTIRIDMELETGDQLAEPVAEHAPEELQTQLRIADSSPTVVVHFDHLLGSVLIVVLFERCAS